MKKIILLLSVIIIGFLLGIIYSLYEKFTLINEKVSFLEKDYNNVKKTIKKEKKYQKKVQKLLKSVNNFDYDLKDNNKFSYDLNLLLIYNNNNKKIYKNIIKNIEDQQRYIKNNIIKKIESSNSKNKYAELYTRNRYKKINNFSGYNIKYGIKNSDNYFKLNKKGKKIQLSQNNNWIIVEINNKPDKKSFIKQVKEVQYYTDIKELITLFENGFFDIKNIDVKDTYWAIKNIATKTEKKYLFKKSARNMPISEKIQGKIKEAYKEYLGKNNKF